MIRFLFPLAGLFLHGFKHVQDRYPAVFTNGWREISSYVVGSVCVVELSALLMREWGASEDERRRARYAYLQTLVWFGGGVALGWVLDVILPQIQGRARGRRRA